MASDVNDKTQQKILSILNQMNRGDQMFDQIESYKHRNNHFITSMVQMCYVEWVEELNERSYSSIWNGM